MAGEPLQVPQHVAYEETANADPSGPGTLRGDRLPGPAARVAGPCRAPETSRAIIAPQDAGPHSSLRQTSASMPSLLVTDNLPGDDSQEENEGNNRPRAQRSSLFSHIQEMRWETPQIHGEARDNLALALCAMMERNQDIQRERDDRQLQYRREERERLALERENKRKFQRELLAMMARSLEVSRAIGPTLQVPACVALNETTSTLASSHNETRPPGAESVAHNELSFAPVASAQRASRDDHGAADVAVMLSVAIMATRAKFTTSHSEP